MSMIKIRAVLVLLCLLIATGCASNPPTGPVYDPLENANRKVYRFNTAFDNAILKPTAKAYRFVLPDFVENGIGNFFSNLGDVTVVVNDLLQGKFKQAASDTGRLAVNTTVGLAGFIDVGTRIGLPKHRESFGQTFGVWGIGEGAFLMVPFLGPKNGRSAVGYVTEQFTTYVPPYFTNDIGVNVGLTVLNTVSVRAYLLSAGNLLDQAALDPYLLLRDFWVRQHRDLTWDGKRPVAISEPDYGDDGLDELDELDRLDALDGTDELDELDELDRLDALDGADELDELDELDRLDALDEADALEKAVDL